MKDIRSSSRTLRKLTFIAFTLVGLALGLIWGLYNRNSTVDLQDLSATVLTPPRPLQSFSLIDHNGKEFSSENFQNRWTFVFFGYTHCPDICPATMAIMGQTYQNLADQGHGDHGVVFVTVDPARDTVDRLAQYVPYFNESFVGVTGDLGSIDGLTKQLGVVYLHHGEGEDYLVDHSSAVLLIDPDAGLRAVFSPPFEPETMARDFAAIKSNS